MDRVKLAKRLLKINYVLAIVIVILLALSHAARADVGRAKIDANKSPIGTKVPGEIRVMEIDTGISKHSKLEGIVQYDESDNYIDNHGHGTHVAGIIVYGNQQLSSQFDFSNKVCKRVQIFSCRFYDPNSRGNDNLRSTINCFERAIKEKIDVINISEGGVDYSEQEYRTAQRYIESGGLVVAAAGNERSKLEDLPYYPACYGIPHIRTRIVGVGQNQVVMHIPIDPLNQFIVVMNVDENGDKAATSNFADYPIKKERGQGIFSTLPGDRYGLMSGTSQAAPAHLHKLLLKKCNEMNQRE